MRLIERRNGGSFSLTRDLVDNIPPYAILSHTWGVDGEEVSYQDLSEHAHTNKSGYNKIQFCGEQAAKDGLQFLWVDTCCIDKSSSAELTESINSMFRWYREALKCYVYLSDVPNVTLRNSRWFTRGWTLQELIAPRSVESFSSKCQRLGTKSSMEREIHEITGIPLKALRGHPLSDFSVTERVSWAAKRRNTRKEDEAYCLLGIFDVHMPLIYGEREHAFIRLNEVIDRRLKGVLQYRPLSQATLVQSSPSSSPWNTYNCNGKVKWLFSGTMRIIRCYTCGWQIEAGKHFLGRQSNPEQTYFVGSKKRHKPMYQPTFGDRRVVPHLVVWERFHHYQDDQALYRCYICRDRRNFDWDDMKKHIEEHHTYAQIVTEEDEGKYGRLLISGGSTWSLP